ncbi:MAG TPA: hypothetical protein VGP81_05450, partial [Pyrinomonadaceae bacterium]|nr:hypothetical protein [Pyrinomonadaceae bacterium]
MAETAAATAASVIQITKTGANIPSDTDEFAALRRTFVEQHWLLLPNFLDARLLELIEKKLEGAEYRVVDRETGVELRPID